jgi:hypothetical protein
MLLECILKELKSIDLRLICKSGSSILVLCSFACECRFVKNAIRPFYRVLPSDVMMIEFFDFVLRAYLIGNILYVLSIW